MVKTNKPQNICLNITIILKIRGTYPVQTEVLTSVVSTAGAPQVWYQPSKPPSNPEVNFGSAHVTVEPADMERLAQGSKTEENWRQEVLDLLKQMALQQKEVVQQLGELEKQVGQFHFWLVLVQLVQL